MTALEETAAAVPGADTVDRVAAALERHTGMRVQSAQRVRLKRAIGHRMQALSAPAGDDYAARVERDPQEWHRLVPEVAVGETHFFRDRERWVTIERHVIPDLVARFRGRRLHLWSAGCATGQEAYGLSMVCHRLREHLPGLQADVLGSDINGAALEVARRGRYPEGAMRGLKPSDRTRFFEAAPDGFRVRPEVRDGVRFEVINLLEWAGLPHPGPAFDLILCQRVLIYLSPEATQRILLALAAALAPGGMLLVGHTETITAPAGCALEWIGPSHGFRRQAAQAPFPDPVPQAPPAPDAAQVLARAWEAAIAERYAEAEKWLKGVARIGEALRLAAWIALCRGDRPRAGDLVKRALAEAPTDPEPHLLAGLVALAGDRADAALAHLKRAVYLDPGCAPAHFHIAALAAAAGRTGEARRAWRTAERASAADGERIRRFFGFDAAAFAQVCRGHLGGGDEGRA